MMLIALCMVMRWCARKTKRHKLCVNGRIYEWKTFTNKITISMWSLFIHKSLPVKSNVGRRQRIMCTIIYELLVLISRWIIMRGKNLAWIWWSACFICIGDVLSSMRCKDGSKLTRPGKFSNEIENYLIACDCFQSIQMTIISLFRAIFFPIPAIKCAFFVIINGDHTELAYNSICIHIWKSVHVLANHNYFMSNWRIYMCKTSPSICLMAFFPIQINRQCVVSLLLKSAPIGMQVPVCHPFCVT